MNDDEGTLSLSAAFLALCAAVARPSPATRTVAHVASGFAALRSSQRAQDAYWRAQADKFERARAESQALVPADVRAALNLLGLNPQCSRDQFKIAYRQKVLTPVGN